MFGNLVDATEHFDLAGLHVSEEAQLAVHRLDVSFLEKQGLTHGRGILVEDRLEWS